MASHGWVIPTVGLLCIALTCAQQCKIQVYPELVSHHVNPMHMGCHEDSGYAHNARGFYSELIYGSSFEPLPDAPTPIRQSHASALPPPVQRTSWLIGGTASLSSTDPLQKGARSLLLSKPGDVAINRGFGGEGLVLSAGQLYEGYLVLRSVSIANVTVSLQRRDGYLLATSTVRSVGGQEWTKVDFQLTPSQSTECEGINYTTALAEGIGCPFNNTYSDTSYHGPIGNPAAHICVRCGGQVTLDFESGSEVYIAFASLQPGAWGRYKDLPVKADAINILETMGVQMIRQGGSFTKGTNQHWRNWRGPVWKRPSAVHGVWGHGAMSGWGPFELIDLCNAMGITAVVSTFCTISPEDYADFIEYCWGNSSTVWGHQRHLDGHPEPYNITYIELGNEQYNGHFVEQVKALEKRANELGLNNTFHYIFPDNIGPNAKDAAAASALGLGERLVVDIHSGPFDGLSRSQKIFNAESTKTWGVINLETNCGTHDMGRALDEARGMNVFFAESDARVLGRASSFCMERSGYQEGGANDQGIVFFLPNMTWLQPPGHVHAMIAKTWQPWAVAYEIQNCSLLGPDEGFVSAQASRDGRSIVVRLVNSAQHSQNVSVSMGKPAEVRMTMLTSLDAKASNTPAEPSKVKPSAPLPVQDTQSHFQVPGLSYVVVEMSALDAVFI